jgi:hypothetical protein
VPNNRDDERGSSLVWTLLVVFSLLALTVASLLGTRFDTKISSNYQSGIQALFAAESGLFHAQELINERGVVNFDNDIIANWGSLFGSSTLAIQGYPQFTYSVAAASDSIDPANFMTLTSTGGAPNESRRTVAARLTVNGVFSPGAIYLPGDSVSPNFNGDSFLIDGHDTNLDGTLHPSGDVPGIGTRATAAQQGVLAALSGQQADNVIGQGGAPSVRLSNGFTTSQLDTVTVPAILAGPGVVNNPALNGHDTFGTRDSPQITHFSTSVTINGNLSGYGILIVDQGLTLSGSSTFTGLIIVKGTTQLTATQGDTTILGALWTTDLQLTVGGNASVTYSSQALALVNALFSTPVLPRRVRVVAWGGL